ncbi:hypothetical protein CNR22_19115 [Sphingobacteriaceae bacterium]|nr:hypothetical protein CNR22_19115 [Sphingobacteriaceae bacterium]
MLTKQKKRFVDFNRKVKMKILEWIVEALSWLNIAASPTILGLFLGFLFYLYKPDVVGLIFGSLISIVGLVIGITLATNISKKMGATEFNSRIYASPDLDKLDEEKTDS